MYNVHIRVYAILLYYNSNNNGRRQQFRNEMKTQ